MLASFASMVLVSVTSSDGAHSRLAGQQAGCNTATGVERIKPSQIAAERGHELAPRVRLDLGMGQSADLCLDIEGVPRGVARGGTSGTRDVGPLDVWLALPQSGTVVIVSRPIGLWAFGHSITVPWLVPLTALFPPSQRRSAASTGPCEAKASMWPSLVSTTRPRAAAVRRGASQ
jgi:hypothetical protein